MTKDVKKNQMEYIIIYSNKYIVIVNNSAEHFMKKRNTCICLILVVVIVAFSVKYMPVSLRVSSNVNGRELPVYSVETEKKQVSLTFDCAWGDEYTDAILAVLSKYNVHSTFFMTGSWVGEYPEDVKKIVAAGHELGNHSESHKNMAQLTDEEQNSEIMSVHEKVKALTGVEMNMFRAPYGEYNDSLILNAEKNGYFTIQWDINSEDWKDYGKDSILDKVLKSDQLKNGSIILCHNGAKYTTEALDELVAGLQEKGYEIVPVSQLIYKEDYHMDVKGRQIKNN